MPTHVTYLVPGHQAATGPVPGSSACRVHSQVTLPALRAYLSTVDVSFRPARMTVVSADGQDVLRVEVTAPSPLGVIGPQSSP